MPIRFTACKHFVVLRDDGTGEATYMDDTPKPFTWSQDRGVISGENIPIALQKAIRGKVALRTQAKDRPDRTTRDWKLIAGISERI